MKTYKALINQRINPFVRFHIADCIMKMDKFKDNISTFSFSYAVEWNMTDALTADHALTHYEIIEEYFKTSTDPEIALEYMRKYKKDNIDSFLFGGKFMPSSTSIGNNVSSLCKANALVDVNKLLIEVIRMLEAITYKAKQ